MGLFFHFFLSQNIYSQVFVEYSVKNPLQIIGDPIESELFGTVLDEHVKASPFFKWKFWHSKEPIVYLKVQNWTS